MFPNGGAKLRCGTPHTKFPMRYFLFSICHFRENMTDRMTHVIIILVLNCLRSGLYFLISMSKNKINLFTKCVNKMKVSAPHY